MITNRYFAASFTEKLLLIPKTWVGTIKHGVKPSVSMFATLSFAATLKALNLKTPPHPNPNSQAPFLERLSKPCISDWLRSEGEEKVFAYEGGKVRD